MYKVLCLSEPENQYCSTSLGGSCHPERCLCPWAHPSAKPIGQVQIDISPSRSALHHQIVVNCKPASAFSYGRACSSRFQSFLFIFHSLWSMDPSMFLYCLGYLNFCIFISLLSSIDVNSTDTMALIPWALSTSSLATQGLARIPGQRAIDSILEIWSTSSTAALITWSRISYLWCLLLISVQHFPSFLCSSTLNSFLMFLGVGQNWTGLLLPTVKVSTTISRLPSKNFHAIVTSVIDFVFLNHLWYIACSFVCLARTLARRAIFSHLERDLANIVNHSC